MSKTIDFDLIKTDEKRKQIMRNILLFYDNMPNMNYQQVVSGLQEQIENLIEYIIELENKIKEYTE